MFNYRIATDEERTNTIPEEYRNAYADKMGWATFDWECRYICGDYMLCSFDNLDGSFAWAAAKLTDQYFGFVIGNSNDSKDISCAMECAIKLHEFLLATTVAENTRQEILTKIVDGKWWCEQHFASNCKHPSHVRIK